MAVHQFRLAQQSVGVDVVASHHCQVRPNVGPHGLRCRSCCDWGVLRPCRGIGERRLTWIRVMGDGNLQSIPVQAFSLVRAWSRHIRLELLLATKGETHL